MKKFGKIRGILAVVVALITLFSFPLKVGATLSTEYMEDDILADIPTVSVAENTGKLSINAKSVVLMEVKTKRVLYSDNSDELLAPASITKIMSLLLVMEAIENEKISPETVVSTSEHAAGMGGSQIWLEPGETMTVDELLRASVIASANDATVALAEAVAGSEETFVEQMNKRAKELGMNSTTFKNACGLDAEGHLTTAGDVAIMSAELISHDLIKKYSTVWMDALRDGKSELVNTNKLVRYYNGATGLKTGTTSKAGCCVSATAERNNMELVAVVMGAESSTERFAGAKKLLDFGFANWTFEELTPDITALEEIEVTGGMTKFVTPEALGSVSLLLEKGSVEKAEQKIEILKEIKAPVKIGDRIGKISFYIDGEKVGETDIIAGNDVEAVTFFSMLSLFLYSAFEI